MTFDLFELLGRDAVYGTPAFAEIDRDAAVAILEEADRYARRELAPTFSDVGREAPAFDPGTRSVRLPREFRAAASGYLESGWLDLDHPGEAGVAAVPPSLRWCVAELMLGANPAVPQGLNVIPQIVRLLLSHGTPDQRRLAELVREKRWMVTMVLTEPDAGSDVGAARTRAVRQPDGTWHIEGVKRFITYGDHDLTDNIVHTVLARPVGVRGAGGPGTKGLSLFVVPKFHVDLATGQLGERNGVEVTGLEHKHGLTASPTCELTFGERAPAVGWLLGESHAGIAQMFEIITHIRMLVGVKSMAALSTGYLNAREYAATRIQGASLSDGTRRRVPIIEHPDVRRSLMVQKTYSEGMRALILYAGTQQDRVEAARAAGHPDQDADRRHQLLLPVIKGFCSEMAWQVLGRECLQTFGGSGFLVDYPIEQYLRDTKVDSLYEGTTAIQGLDLLSRKIARDDGRTLRALLDDVARTAETGLPGLDDEARLLATAARDVAAMADLLAAGWNAGGEKRAAAAQNGTRLLLCLGDLTCGWLLLRGSAVADAALTNAALAGSPSDRDFYLGKAAGGRWFARNVLPRITADLTSARLTWTDLGSLPATAL